jgi:hypothetical protein
MPRHLLLRFVLVLTVFASTAAPALRAQSMPGMDVSSASAAMDGDMMPMAHMTMTKLAPARPGDAVRAAAIADTVGRAIEKYADYHVALEDGFTIFLPKIPQRIYHFTSRANAIRSQWAFDPARPTSLLYRKTSDGYRLVGAMFTAPNRDTPAELNERVPLSVAEWHMHTNLCLPPRGQEQAMLPTGNSMPRFGFHGTIVSADACKTAGGHFHATVFGWMVHVSPWEKDPALVWGAHDGGDDDHRGMTGH